MSKSYHDIMDKIEVTDEMRSRLLARTAAQLEERSLKEMQSEKQLKWESRPEEMPPVKEPRPEGSRLEKKGAGILSMRHRRVIASVAACFAVLIAGSAMLKETSLPSILPGSSTTQGTVDQMIYRVVDCDSPAELAEQAGFSISVPQSIPFEVNEISYSWQWNTIAEIDYYGSENELCYRKAAGTDDISGDYTEYELVREVPVNGASVTIREEAGRCYLATWQKDGYTHAVSLTQGAGWNEFLLILESIV